MKTTFKKNCDINLTMEVETPHSKWGKPLAGGPLSALFVPSIVHGREVIELAQRMDLRYETVIVDRNWDNNKWGLGDFYDLRGGIWNDAMVMENLENAVCSDMHFDVMFIPGINGWRRFSDKAKDAILNRVKNGAGLVINQPQHGVDMPEVEGSLPAILTQDREAGEYRAPSYHDKWLAELSPLVPLHEERYRPDGYANIDYDVLGHENWVFSGHYITNDFPAGEYNFAELGYYPYKADGDVIISSESGAPIAAVKQVGKGRVVALGYFPKVFSPNDKSVTPAEGGCFESVNMAAITPENNVGYDTSEYFYALLGRVMLWAAGRDKNAFTEAVIKDNALHVSGSESKITYRVKNNTNELVAEGVADNGQVPVPAGVHGKLRYEILAHSDKGVVDWKIVVQENTPAAKASFVPDETRCNLSLKTGDVFSAEANFDLSGLENAAWVLNVVDDFENIVWTAKGKESGSHKINYTVEPTQSLNLRGRATIITADGFTLVKAETPRVTAVLPFRGINDFEAFLSPTIRGNSALLNLIGERMRGLGVTGLFPGGNRTVASSGADGLGVYWYKRAEYVKSKEDYLRTGDKQFLCRKPCLNNPNFWQEMQGKIEAAVTEGRKTAPVSYFANDEGSLTCYKDEREFCFCTYCITGIREWLKGQYGNLSELNKVWKTNYENWEQVVPDTFDEAYARNHFRAWSDHRLYMELVFAGAYEKMIKMVRRYDSGGVLRMSGCQESSAYTGCDYYELHKHVGYFEAYGGGNQMEMHRSFMHPGTMVGGWTGYGVNGITARHQIWYRTLHGLALHSLFWFYSNINPDFSYPKTATDLSKPLIELRRKGVGKLLLHGSTRDALGIALHYSMRSVHGAYARGNEQKFANNREGWVNLLEDCGYQYNFIATQQIEKGELENYRVLILPYSIELSDKEVAAIHQFAKDGGTVIGDFQTAVMDLPPKSPGKLDDIFGIKRRNIHNRRFFTCHEFKRSENFTLFDLPENNAEFCLDGFTIAEEGIRLAPGSVAGYYHDFAPALSAVVVNHFGKGKGIYLNTSMDAYVQVRKSGDGEMRRLIKKVLDFAGIVKFCSLHDPVSGEPIEAGHETVYFSAVGAKYVAVLRDMEETRAMSHDGLVVGGSGEMEETVSPLKLTFSEKAHIYDVRAGVYLGEIDKAEVAMAAGDAKVLAILPEKLDKLECITPAEVKPGDVFDITITAVTASGKTPGSSVFAVEFTKPSGTRAWDFCENIACPGKTSLTRKLPYNAECGTWTVAVLDAATGVNQTPQFEVKGQ